MSPTTPAIIPLPQAALPCATCGVAVAGDEAAARDVSDLITLTSYGRAGEFQPASRRVPVPALDLTLTRCPACQDMHQRAQSLLDAHPRVQYAIGSRDVAEHRVECALAALDALGQTGPAIRSDRDLSMMLDHLTIPGAGARWSSRFVPVMLADADPETCAAEPWAHLVRDSERTQRLRDAFAGWLAARIEQPEPILCPSGGCLFCGVWAVMALPSQSLGVWTQRRAVPPGALGGKASPTLRDGTTCPVCEAAIVEVGSIGPTSMERALVSFLGVSRRSISLTSTQLIGLQGWAGLPQPAEPNGRPWEHVEGLEELRRELLAHA